MHCPCGHVCGGPSKSSSANRSKNIATKTNQKHLTEEKVCISKASVELTSNRPTVPQTCMRNVTIKQDSVFRRPSVYPGNGSSSDSFRAQLDVSFIV